MPDWRQWVGERLGPLEISQRRRQEIIAELADHLEDCCLTFDPEGKSGSGACEKAREQVPDWNQLAGEIRSAEVDMNERTRFVWIPGLAVFALTGVFLMVVQRAGLRPTAAWLDPRIPLLFYWPWLVALPVIGAIGAYWSRRAGGRFSFRILAGVFPIVPFLALLVLSFPLALVIDRQVPLNLKFVAWAMYMLNWVLIPGGALLLGTLPFLRNSIRKIA